LPHETERPMPDVPGASTFGEGRHGHGGEAAGIVQLALREQASGGDLCSVELELEAALEGDLKGWVRPTRRVRHPAPVTPLLCP
jgi:hypothetical protein